jgi:hypothetical protein
MHGGQEGSISDVTSVKLGADVLRHLLNDTQHRCLYIGDIYILMKAKQQTVEVFM